MALFLNVLLETSGLQSSTIVLLTLDLKNHSKKFHRIFNKFLNKNPINNPHHLPAIHSLFSYH